MAAGAVALLAAACGDDPQGLSEGPDAGEGTVYAVEVSGERFHVLVTDTAALRGMEERMASGDEGVILGTLAAGDGGFNEPWSWHMVPGTVEVPDLAVEVCDGRPSFVEEDLDYWLDTVGTFCPWGARVIERVEGG